MSLHGRWLFNSSPATLLALDRCYWSSPTAAVFQPVRTSTPNTVPRPILLYLYLNKCYCQSTNTTLHISSTVAVLAFDRRCYWTSPTVLNPLLQYLDQNIDATVHRPLLLYISSTANLPGSLLLYFDHDHYLICSHPVYIDHFLHCCYKFVTTLLVTDILYNINIDI